MAAGKKVLTGEEALVLARQGHDAWNKWAYDHKGWEVSFGDADFDDEKNNLISFNRFFFPGPAYFDYVKFHDQPWFHRAVFASIASFNDAEFLGDSGFGDAWFLDEAQFANAVFSGYTEFWHTTFGSTANFSGVKFAGDVEFFFTTFLDGGEFERVEFSGAAGFDYAVFEDWACFEKVTFGGWVSLRDAKFLKGATFENSSFRSALDLDRASFFELPDFQRTKLDRHVSMDSIEVKFFGQKLWKFWQKAIDERDAAKYRRLKEMAVLAQDHFQEQNFFAMEQKAMRETRYIGAAMIPGLLFETLSDFGRSLKRPAFWLVAVWLVFAACFLFVGYKSYTVTPSLVSLILAALLYSGAQLVPFVGNAGGAKVWSAGQLFFENVPGHIHLLGLLEGLCAFILIFLIGLGLRNRFRI